MKKNKIFKIVAFAVVFCTAFVGVNMTSGKSSNQYRPFQSLDLITLGSQSMAYCNSAEYENEITDGKCTGERFNNADVRCLETQNNDANCTRGPRH